MSGRCPGEVPGRFYEGFDSFFGGFGRFLEVLGGLGMVL